LSRNSGSLKILEPSGPVLVCNGIALRYEIKMTTFVVAIVVVVVAVDAAAADDDAVHFT
jgi:hypothetical protein